MATQNDSARTATRKNVTKRTRYEVLNRDGFACQYCGAKAPDVELHVDHVIPVALGGDNKPGNLVAACKDCNAGKGASNPDSPLVERLSDEAATYALAMANKTAAIVQRLADDRAYAMRFHEYWERRAPVPPFTLDEDWRTTVGRWHAQGIPVELLEHAIDVAVAKEKRGGLSLEDVFRYMAGVVYRTLDDEGISSTLSSTQTRLYTEQEYHANGMEWWESGIQATYLEQQFGLDELARHIDKGLASDVYDMHAWMRPKAVA